MPPSAPLVAGSARISSAEVPPDVHGLVVHADGFTVASEGRAFLVRLAPADAAVIGRHLLHGAAKRGMVISDQ